MKTFLSKKSYTTTMAFCVIVVVFALTRCSKSMENQSGFRNANELKNAKYEVGVMESSEEVRRSVITYYNADFKRIGAQTIPYHCSSDNFDQGRVDKNKFFTITWRPYKSMESAPIVSVDLKSHKIQEYNFSKKLYGEKWFLVSGDVIYANRNLNGITYLEAYNMRSGRKTSVTLKSKIVTFMNCDRKHIYGFGIGISDNNDNSPIYKIDKKSLELVSTVDVGYPADSCASLIYKSKLYLPTDEEEAKGKYASKLFIYDLEKEKKEKILPIKANATNNIVRHKDRIFIALASPADGSGRRIAIMRMGTRKIKYAKFKHNVSQIKVKGDRLYVLDNKYDSKTTLYRYRIEGDKFIREKKKNVFTQGSSGKHYFVGTFFVK